MVEFESLSVHILVQEKDWDIDRRCRIPGDG